MASGLIPALRKAHPDAHIAWLCEPGPAVLLNANPHLDEVIVWQRPRWRELGRHRRYHTLLGEVRRFVAGLRYRGFTQVIDLQGLLKSGVWAWLSGAPQRIGLGSKEGSQYLMTRTVSRQGEDRRIGAEYRKLAAVLGCDPREFRLDIEVEHSDARQAQQQLRENGVTVPYAVIAPFTTRPQKHWLESRWPELAARIIGDMQMPVVMLGGPDDRAAAQRIMEAEPRITDLAGQLGLGASAAVVKGAGLMIGVDTGLTHMGSAFRIPTVALFGATRPYLDPDAPDTHILYRKLPCAPCRYNPTCGGAYTCMREIAVNEVMEAAISAMGRK